MTSTQAEICDVTNCDKPALTVPPDLPRWMKRRYCRHHQEIYDYDRRSFQIEPLQRELF